MFVLCVQRIIFTLALFTQNKNSKTNFAYKLKAIVCPTCATLTLDLCGCLYNNILTRRESPTSHDVHTILSFNRNFIISIFCNAIINRILFINALNILTDLREHNCTRISGHNRTGVHLKSQSI